MSNPFAALLEENTNNNVQEISELCNTIEYVFGFTLSKSRSNEKNLLYLEEQVNTYTGQNLDLSILEHALFERLLLVIPGSHPNDFKYENRVLKYLFACYNNNFETVDSYTQKSVKELIMRNVLTSLKQPELFSEQDVFAQFYDILKNAEINSELFFDDIYRNTLEDEDDFEDMKSVYMKLLKSMHVEIAKSNILNFNINILNILIKFSNFENLASIFLDYCKVKDANIGIEYSNTLLGALLSISILPKTVQGEYIFFPDPLDQPSNAAHEGLLHTNTDKITHCIYTIILNILKLGSLVRMRMLSWLGNCLKANADRGKIWATQAMDMPNMGSFNTVSDGMIINLLTVIMQFCQPFCGPQNEKKVLRVDPTYCAVNTNDCEEKGVHLLDLNKETCLIPIEGDDITQAERPTASNYSFVSECFYMGHRSFDLGYRVTVDKLVKLNQEMVRIERTYNDAISQSAGPNDIADAIKSRMKLGMQKYLSVKATLSNPSLIDIVFNFISSTAIWLNQVAIKTDFTIQEQQQYAPLTENEIVFPLPNSVPVTLRCIPEFIVENIVCYLVFLRRFSPKVFEMQGYTRLSPILTFILIYMGSPERMKNPHLRARLAEALEALLPFHKDEPPGLNTLGGFQREMLFKTHIHRREIVRSLLEVFVGIEMTGQSVQFEQKFNYRRPMYLVMDYLWELPEHKEYFRELAKDAEKNMEAVMPPLFLRFINLLMNDAVFLLDEALANMAKLKELHAARENGEWNNLPIMERSQNMGYLQHIGMIARFNNILGRDTIRTLVNLTSEITIVFTHSTMVDRVAAMLNYFLLKLVGPNQKDFKVKDNKEYSFKPGATVLDICKMYVHLKESEAFCLAVSQDGRSYSPQLFKLAEDVLVRIGGGALVGELQVVAERVAMKAAEAEANEEFLAEAPDNYLDPIMSTLMLDPVILPSSKQVVDRTTIARHLLSDQTDPFNRSPLTLDQVIPNKELSEEIHAWLAERKSSK